MKYQVLETFKVRTLKEEIELQSGQIVTLPHDKAIRLLNEGKITPIEKVAYKVYSELLQAHLWVVDTDEDMHSLRSQGISAAIYTGDEIRKLRSLSKDSLKEIHKAKEVFPESIVDEVKDGK
ncbi:MAG: hypothetical protein V2A53_00125 [bacterium]